FAGIGNSSPRSSMDLSFAGLWDVLPLMRRSSVWSCAWPGRTQVGAMTRSWERWRIWDTRSQTKPWQHPEATRHSTCTETKEGNELEGLIRAHMAVMVGTDFFTVEVLTLKGLKTFYVL